ncbi:hypothetical protein A0H81_02194 [Grifola frondosa]|uniref:Uncharacterized protein n=1 Tax=Grifola frondosa TaxID=5627 RepID=A0A1C7MLN8_GRIFR|nr:hypothetical protein A0H81_02194 [Grifola frondosa]
MLRARILHAVDGGERTTASPPHRALFFPPLDPLRFPRATLLPPLDPLISRFLLSSDCFMMYSSPVPMAFLLVSVTAGI